MITLILLLTSCTSGSVELPTWEPVMDLPLTYDPTVDLWLAPVPGGCDPEYMVTATCEVTGDVGPGDLSWRVQWADAQLDVPPCDVGVDAPADAGPCTATIWAPVVDGGEAGI